jgi:hypothetical protein
MQTHGKTNIENEPIMPNRFGRLFPTLLPFRPNDAALDELGKSMVDPANSNSNSTIPAGYTYLGQFIDHDISKDALGGVDPATLPPKELGELIQLRTPSLDLDSLYGSGDTEHLVEFDPSDFAKFAIGIAHSSAGAANNFPNDLFRDNSSIDKPAKALIGDPRNDENLAVAQTHLAFMKFHNAVVDVLRRRNLNPNVDAIALRNQAREIVVKHYQSIVLHDFLKHFVDNAVYADVIVNGNAKFFKVISAELPFMPIEFSAACYRWHTLIRDDYNWNRVFNANKGTLELLFRFTGLQNQDKQIGFNPGDKTLPSNWIVDWTRFYDFTSRNIPSNGLNFTKPIDTLLSATLHSFGPPRSPMNLAVKNLIRGSRVGLPCAQDIAWLTGIPALTEQQLLAGTGAQGAILEKHEFHKKTPLWYYLNREAEIAGTGKFGTLGSTIICEVFHGLTKGSRISILDENDWKPDADLLPADPNFYTMPDLLFFIQQNNLPNGVDELNPIG